MRLRRKKGAVVWAVDPTEEGLLPADRELLGVREWLREENTSLLLVQVVPAPQFNNGKLPPSDVVSIELAMWRFSERIALEDVPLRSRLVLGEAGSLKSAVDRVLMEAEKEASPWIILSSQGGSSGKRFLSESFAERLLLESPVPVLFLPFSAQASVSSPKRLAVFATDFSGVSRLAFSRFLAVAKVHGLQVLLIYFLPLSYPWPDATLSLVSSMDFSLERVEWARAQGKLWIAEARARGVGGRFELHREMNFERGITSLPRIALAERASLIVMISPQRAGFHFGKFGGPASGLPRSLFESRQLLIWFYGPRALLRRTVFVA